MRRLRPLFVQAAMALAVGSAAVTAALGGVGAAAPVRVSLPYDGEARSYLLFVPADLSPGPVPLVIVLHGGAQTAEDIAINANNPTAHWMSLADAEGFVVAYPDGLDKQWHDCRSEGHADIGTADDVGFINALIDDVARSREIDWTRVYVAGASNGGMMAYRLGAELSHRLAAIVPGIASMPTDAAGECRNPDRPLTVAMMNGDADEPAWSGGQTGTQGGATEHGAVIGTAATLNYWIAHNATGSGVDDFFPYPDINAGDGPTTVERSTYLGGGEDAEVTLYRVRGGGHSMPSTHHLASLVYRTLYGAQNWDTESSEDAWELIRHAYRPGAGPSTPLSLLADGFESGSLAAGTWSTTGSAAASNSTAHDGNYAARLQKIAALTATLSTTGYSRVRARFALKTSSLNVLDADEYLYAEWSADGIAWHPIKKTRLSSWEKETFTLSAAAAGQAALRLRFRTDANQNTEYGYVDDVELIVE